MATKKTISEIVVVEGKTDSVKLQHLFNVDTIITNGSAINKETISLIKQLALGRGVILFLDPDGPGEKIRKTITNAVSETKQCFLKKSDMIKSKHKIGVAEAKDEAIINAFENIVTFKKQITSTLSWEDYLKINLNTREKRKLLTKQLHISEANHKQLFKRLNMLSLDYAAIKKLVS